VSVTSAAVAALVVGPSGSALADRASGHGPATGPAPTTTDSKVWLTVRKEGGLGELYYPDLGTPAARTLELVVSDGRHAVRSGDGSRVRVQTVLTDGRSPSYGDLATVPEPT
jgi:glucoamylase